MRHGTTLQTCNHLELVLNLTLLPSNCVILDQLLTPLKFLSNRMHLECASDMTDSDPEDLFFNWTHVHCTAQTNGATAQRNSFRTSVQHEVEWRKQGLVRMVNVYFADKDPLIFFFPSKLEGPSWLSNGRRNCLPYLASHPHLVASIASFSGDCPVTHAFYLVLIFHKLLACHVGLFSTCSFFRTWKSHWYGW